MDWLLQCYMQKTRDVKHKEHDHAENQIRVMYLAMAQVKAEAASHGREEENKVTVQLEPK